MHCWILPKIHIIQSPSTPTCGPWFNLYSPWPQISVTRAASPDHPLNRCSFSFSFLLFFVCLCLCLLFTPLVIYIPFLCLYLYLFSFVFLFLQAYSEYQQWVTSLLPMAKLMQGEKAAGMKKRLNRTWDGVLLSTGNSSNIKKR